MTNQLVDEALPDLSEFDSMSIVDIAYAITLWPEGSPDQLRAIEAIRARAPGIGHNRPPLADRLESDFAELKTRADLALKAKPVILDQESAGKVLDLMRTMRDLAGEANTLRQKLQKPYHDAAQAVAAASETVRAPLLAQVPVLQAMVTAWDDKQRAEAEDRRQKALQEQRDREAAAAEARRKADEAADAGKSTVIADKAAEHLREEAERAAIRAEAIRPEPVRGNLGQGTRRKVIKFKVENIREVLGELLRDAADRARVEEATDQIVGAKLRAVGVAGVERGITIKGLKAWVELGAVTARR